MGTWECSGGNVSESGMILGTIIRERVNFVNIFTELLKGDTSLKAMGLDTTANSPASVGIPVGQSTTANSPASVGIPV